MVVKSVQAFETNRQVHHDVCSDGPQVEGEKILQLFSSRDYVAWHVSDGFVGC